jgi:hypothetical protein
MQLNQHRAAPCSFGFPDVIVWTKVKLPSVLEVKTIATQENIQRDG